MKYGRVDVSGPEQCPEEGRLPGKYTFDVYRFGLVYFTMAPTLNKITVTVHLFVSWIIHRNCVD